MKKRIINLIIRIFILFFAVFLILFFVDKLLSLKTKSNNSHAWYTETDNINHMLLKKYHNKKSDYYPIILNKDVEIKDKSDKKRILVVGDSFVWGYANPNINNVWWKLLYQKLKENGYNDIEIFAAGCWGYSTEDEYNNILSNEKLIKKVNPDLIIITWVTNDMDIKDKNGTVAYKEIWDYAYNLDNPKVNKFRKAFPNIWDEVRNRIYSNTENRKILNFFGKIFGYRWDIKLEAQLQEKELKKYKKILNKMDKKIKSYDIPYFYYMQNFVATSSDSPIFKSVTSETKKIMDELNIKNYYQTSINQYIYEFINNNNLSNSNLLINPADSHSSSIVTDYYANDVYNILHNEYQQILPKKEQIEMNLNINDTMPYIKIKKQENKFSFIYPKEKKNNLLYLPLNKNYVKLNLEFPKNIKEIKITGNNLKHAKLYLNTIDEKTNIDLDSARQRFYIPNLTADKKSWIINKKVSSLNIIADFEASSDRKIEIEIIE